MVFCAGTVWAENPMNQGCPAADAYSRQVIPDLFLTGQPDSLLTLIYDWEDVCGISEASTRSLVLGAIWDGAFTEELIDDDIIEFLLEYQRGLRDEFDLFTTDLADQLLPHVEEGTVDQFICLFYSGRRAEAWQMLARRELAGTFIQHKYDWELERISLERNKTTFFGTTGYWMPAGNLALAGDKWNIGAMAEMRRNLVFWRLAGDMLIGRTRFPYTVDQPEQRGRSDRFNAVSLVAEAGISPGRGFDFYLGGGLEGTVPFLSDDDQDSVLLVNWKGLIGVGYRREFGKWMTGIDLRREWMTDRNDDGTPLDGRAWSVRLSFGLNPNDKLDKRLRQLQP